MMQPLPINVTPTTYIKTIDASFLSRCDDCGLIFLHDDDWKHTNWHQLYEDRINNLNDDIGLLHLRIIKLENTNPMEQITGIEVGI